MASDQKSNGAELIKRPQQTRIPRVHSPNREGFFDILQELMFDKLTIPASANDVTKHMAIVYRVSKEEAFLGIFSDIIKVRARIAEPDLTHSTFQIPKNYEDNAVINTLVEFEARLDDIGGITPKVGDPIEVEFYNNASKTKMYGNGVIKRLLPSSKISGKDGASESSKSNLFKPAKEDCETGGSTVKPPTGGQLLGENKPVTVSERNPRKLNSPTEDSTPGIAQSRKPNPEEVSAIASVEENPQNQTNIPARSIAPGPQYPSPATNNPAQPGGTKKKDPCESKISTVGDYTENGHSGAPGNLGAGAAGQTFSNPNPLMDGGKGPVPRTHDRSTDRRIAKLHPEFRHTVANFINAMQDKGFYMRVSASYRTPKEQGDLYAKGRTTPKRGKTVTNARGTPASSIHQFGIAIDIVELPSGRDSRTRKKWRSPHVTVSGFDKRYPRARWHEIGRLGKEYGFRWGGDFSGLFDGPHFEIPNQSATRLRRKIDQGRVVIDKKLGRRYKFPKI
jgi:peptidoglycan L-alanyl-D-glutamate endopeptidase CwlK|tara:strand:+ start:8123 stop:9643 length:1521 start_codon:yes stop_codon:yes gene_type:complete